MSMYRKEWDCCGSATETNAWEPDSCPFCTSAAPSAVGAEQEDLPPLPEPRFSSGTTGALFTANQYRQGQRDAVEAYKRKQGEAAAASSAPMPPFAAPAGQHEAIVGAIARGWWATTPAKQPMNDELMHAIAREVGKVLAARCRAQGGNTNNEASSESTGAAVGPALASQNIAQDVVDTFRGAGFEVRDNLGAQHPFGVVGSIDSAAILLDAVLNRPRLGPDGLVPMQALHDIIVPYAESILKRGFTDGEQNKRLHAIAYWIESHFDLLAGRRSGGDAVRDGGSHD